MDQDKLQARWRSIARDYAVTGRFIRVRRLEPRPEAPAEIWIVLDRHRSEESRVEIWPDGRIGFASDELEVGGTKLRRGPFPRPEAFAGHPDLQVEAVSTREFHRFWETRVAPAYRVAWRRKLRQTLTELAGQEIDEVWVDEMGLYGPEEDPCFTHPELKLVQAWVLDLRLRSGDIVRFETYQTEIDFALRARRVPFEDRLQPDDDPSRTLFRIRPMPEFPSGGIGAVRWVDDEEGNIQEISLDVGGHEVIMRAGEVYEDLGGGIKVSDADESVLVFLDRQDYESTVFNEPIYRVP